MKKVLLVTAIAAVCSHSVLAEVNISGFASVMGGKMTSGTGVRRSEFFGAFKTRGGPFGQFLDGFFCDGITGDQLFVADQLVD